MLYAGAQADSSEFLTPVARRIGPVPPQLAANTGTLRLTFHFSYYFLLFVLFKI
jgi:hypothetical protein